MSRKALPRDDLREKITDALMRDVGISEKMAQPFVDSIMRCFAGEQPYFPSDGRDYPLMQIQAALESGLSPKRVAHDFEISRTTLYKLFPGGLPKRVKSGSRPRSQ